MASRKAPLIAATAMAVVVDALLPATAFRPNHVVGDLDGWDLNVDYVQWARNKNNNPIPADDTLEFIYTPGSQSVVMVDEQSYGLCAVLINNGRWDSGDDIVQLSIPGQYFFICDVADHCDQGMKLAVIVV